MTENDFDKNQNDSNTNEKKGFYDEEFEKKSEPQRNSSYNEYYNGVSNPQYQPYPYQYSQPQRTRKKSVTVVIAVLVIVASLLLGYVFYPLLNSQFDEASMYIRAMEILKANYLYDFDYDTVFENMCNGGSLGLDRYTRIFSPLEYYELIYAPDNVDPIYGISPYLASDKSGKALHWAMMIMLDSAADLAGLMDGDVFQRINNTTITAQTTSSEILSLLNGTTANPVTKVSITVKREGVTLDSFEVEKAKLVSRYVEFFFMDANNYYTNFLFKDAGGSYTFDPDFTYPKNEKDPGDFHHYVNYDLEDLVTDKVGFVRLHEFTYTEAESVTNSSKDFNLAMEKFKTAYNKKGRLVLDLRFNRGGFNAYCTSVSSYFIYKGTPDENLALYRLRYKDGEEDTYKVKTKYADYFETDGSDGYKTDRKIIFLTNDWSASASELLTGAALAYETVIQIGTRTYGKGVSQTVIPLISAKTIFNGKVVYSAFAIYFTFSFFYTPDVPGSDSVYSNYCNHNDMNGDGEIDDEERGYMPTENNVLIVTKEIMQRASALFKKT